MLVAKRIFSANFELCITFLRLLSSNNSRSEKFLSIEIFWLQRSTGHSHSEVRHCGQLHTKDGWIWKSALHKECPMSRLVRTSGLRFCQLRVLSSRAKKTRSTAAALASGESGPCDKRDRDTSEQHA